MLRTDGRILTTGCNLNGQLADGTTPNRASMALVPSLSSVQLVRAGHSFTAVMTSAGEVWSAGTNSNGQLGDGTTPFGAVRTPVKAMIAGAVARLAAGHNHGMAVTPTGIVYSWGVNLFGQLGDGTTVRRTPPVAISDVNYVWKVASPVFSLADGTYTTDRTVVITNSTPDAEIHYTSNGGDPTLQDPVIASGGSVAVDRTLTLKARAWRTGMPASNIASATYTMQVSTPVVSPNGGTYTTPQTVSLSTATTGATLRYTTDGLTPTDTSSPYTAPLHIGTTTTLRVVGFRDGWLPSALRTATRPCCSNPRHRRRKLHVEGRRMEGWLHTEPHRGGHVPRCRSSDRPLDRDGRIPHVGGPRRWRGLELGLEWQRPIG